MRTEEVTAVITADEAMEGGFNYDEFGEHGALLPASRMSRSTSPHDYSTRRSFCITKRNLFSNDKLVAIIGRKFAADGDDDSERAQICTELGVELLHLLKFACLNAVGVSTYRMSVVMRLLLY